MRGPPSAFASLLETVNPPDLGPGPRAGVRSIKDLEHDVASACGVIPPEHRKLVLATILLWHDHLDSAHEIAQKIEPEDGSYLHAIMHRREPDYSNAKYWFRRVGRHSCYPALAKHVIENVAPVQPALASKLAPGGEWDAFAFVDACESASRKAPASTVDVLREIQAAEIRTFLEYLASSPTGDTHGG